MPKSLSKPDYPHNSLLDWGCDGMEATGYINAYLFPCIEWAIFAVTLHRVLGRRRRKDVSGIVVFFLIGGLTIVTYYLAPTNVILSTTIQVVTLTIITYFIYSPPPHIAAFFSVMAYYSSVLADLLIGNITMGIYGGDIGSMLEENSVQRLVFSVVAKTFQILVAIAVVKGFQKISWNIPARYWLIMDALLLIYFVMALAFVQVNPYLQTLVSPQIVALVIIFFLFANILTVALFATISNHYINNQLEHSLIATKRNLENESLQIEREKQSTQKAQHDLANTLNNISLLIQHNSSQAALEYISKYSDALPITAITTYTGISAVDSMISVKKQTAADYGINMRTKIEVLTTYVVPVIDLATILSNMLDNAIEANEGLPPENRNLAFHCYVNDGILNIIVTNSYGKHPVLRNGRLVTSKKNHENHGYGTLIIQEICERNQGAFITEHTENLFSAHASLAIDQA